MFKIESLDHYGRGITRIDGKIAFIENALPNEIVEIKVNNNKKKYIEGCVLKYIKKSEKRINPDCPYYNMCGGCNISHITYSEQLDFKQQKIENIIKKYLNIDVKINNIVPCDINTNYRNKVTFHVNKKLGFYNNNTHNIINIDNCLISDKLINNSIKYLNELNLNSISKIICRTASNELMIILETNDKNVDITPIKTIAHSIYLKINNEYKHIYGDKYIYENLENYKFIISPDSFFQININTCLKLLKKIKNYIGKNKNIIDLYCGTGSIGIFVNENNDVIGIEVNEYATKDAIKNKKLNNLNNINFICGDSGKKIKNLNYKTDVIIIDPPRSGLNKETLNNILKFNSKEIIYVSCDPMSLVRDLNYLSQYYDIKEITPFDMFPNTYHIESLCYLIKKCKYTNSIS